MHEIKVVLAVLLIGIVAFCGSCKKATEAPLEPLKSHCATDVYDGWQLGMQTYTFIHLTFYETLEKTSSLGLNWVEACCLGQRLDEARPNLVFGYDMPAQIREEVKNKLKERGLHLVNCYVHELPNDEAACRKIFNFAKDMGIETFVSEPAPEAFDMIERLCEEYKINIAIHHHPKPSSRYWNPDSMLAVCEGRSSRIGVCADTGHWVRSGINPVEAMKKLEGRIICLHLKDVKELGDVKAPDVVWGTGSADVAGILKELDRQNFKGVISVEYEHEVGDPVPDVRKCIDYFDKVASQLKPSGWQDLLAEDLSNCVYLANSWVMEDEVLFAKGGSDIWTKEQYGDFILDLEFNLVENTNSGIFLRTGDIKEWLNTAIEVQVLDSYGKSEAGREDCGAIFDCLAPNKNMVKRPGEWNRCTIACQYNKIYVVLNGEQVIDMDLNLWNKPHKNPDGTSNKFNTAYKNMPRVGHIGFQYHGYPVWYRNIKIKSLDGR